MTSSHSLPSRILNVVNLTEPKIDYDISRFYYNYFLKNETDPLDATDSIENIVTSDPGDSEPRYNKIHFEPNDESTNVWVPGIINYGISPTSGMNTVAPQKDSDLLKKLHNIINNGEIRLDTIIVEGAMSNFYFAGFDLVDTQTDETLNDILNSAAIITDNTFDTDNESPQSIAEKYKNRLLNMDPNSNSIIDPNLIQDFIADISKQNISNVSPTGEILSGRYQSISCGINSFFIDNVIKASTDDSCHVFADEIRALSDLSPTIQANAQEIQTGQLGEIQDDDYTNFLRAGVVQEYSVFDSVDPSIIYDEENNFFEQKSSVIRLGYVVEKIEYFGDDVKVFDPIVRNDVNYSYYDKDVRYGATYVYRVRNLYGVCYTFFNNIANDPGLSQFYRGVFAIASKSSEIKIECVDLERPKPPNNLDFYMIRSYKTQTNASTLSISWEFPVNKKKDIKGFQVFRRDSHDNPFMLLAEFDFNDANLLPILREKAPDQDFYRYLDDDGEPAVFKKFYDRNFTLDKNYIYAIASVDAHGQTSNLSVQVSVKFNSFTEKLETHVISPPNAPKAYPNSFINRDLFEDKMLINSKRRMTVYFNPDHSDVYTQNQDGEKTYKNLISYSKDRNDPRYRISMTNTDLQKSNFLDIVIKDRSTVPATMNSAVIDENNLNFSFVDLSPLPDEPTT